MPSKKIVKSKEKEKVFMGALFGTSEKPHDLIPFLISAYSMDDEVFFFSSEEDLNNWIEKHIGSGDNIGIAELTVTKTGVARHKIIIDYE